MRASPTELPAQKLEAAPQGALRDNANLDRTWLAFFRDLYLGFGPEDGLLLRCVRRAYLDFNRTWHIAPGQSLQRPSVRSQCSATLVRGLSDLSNQHAEQEDYDEWHHRLMADLMRVSDPTVDGSGLTLGQAQKWINMSVKYAIGGRLPHFEQFEQCAHVPIDRILLKALGAHPKFKSAVRLLPEGPWSRMADLQAYDAFQQRLRELAAPESPLILELGLWMTAQGNSRS